MFIYLKRFSTSLGTFNDIWIVPVCASMPTVSMLSLLSAHFVSFIGAAPIPEDLTAGAAAQSHTLSIEALLTLIGVCVAVLALGLTLVLSWPSLKLRWGLCTSRRSHPPFRSRPASKDTFPHITLTSTIRC